MYVGCPIQFSGLVRNSDSYCIHSQLFFGNTESHVNIFAIDLLQQVQRSPFKIYCCKTRDEIYQIKMECYTTPKRGR